MPKRRAEDDEWDLHRDDVLRLYLLEDKPLNKVIGEMGAKGFKRRQVKAQYERVFTKWKIRKNATAEAWQYIATCHGIRESQGRESEVHIHGIRVPQQNLRRQLDRYGYQDTFSRLRNNHSSLTSSACPNMYPNVRVVTPPPSTALLVASAGGNFRGFNSLWISDDQLYDWAETTPWASFMQFIRRFKHKIPHFLLSTSPENQYFAPPMLSESWECDLMYSNYLIGVASPQPQVQDWLTGMAYARMTSFDYFSSTNQRNIFETHQFLPPSRDGSKVIDFGTPPDLDLTQRSTQLEFLKLSVHLLSNSHHNWKLTRSLVELLRDRNNQSLLVGLLKTGNTSLQAFADKLLPCAADIGDLDLVATLLENGANVHAKVPAQSYGSPCSALYFAVKNQHVGIISLLLAHGAYHEDVRIVCSLHPLGYMAGLFLENGLERMVCSGNRAAVQTILESMLSKGTPVIPSLLSFALAASRNNIEMLDYLIDQHPDIHELLHSNFWTLIDAAVWHNNKEMVEHLLQLAPTVNISIHSELHQAMLFASFLGHDELLQLLLSLGASVNIVGRFFGNWTHVLHERHSNIPTTVLQCALVSGKASTIDIIMKHGADLNQICNGLSPLQIATSCCDINIVRRLLDNGAETKICTLHEYFPAPFLSHAIRKTQEKTLVEIALERGDVEIYKLVSQISASMPVHKNDYDLRKVALTTGKLAIVQEISKDLESYPLSEEEFLSYLMRYGTKPTRDLIDQGAIDPKSHISSHVLCEAIYQGDRDFIEYLVEETHKLHGGLPHDFCVAGLTAAAYQLDTEILLMFLGNSVKPYSLYHDHTYTKLSSIPEPEAYSLKRLSYYFQTRAKALSPLEAPSRRFYRPSNPPTVSICQKYDRETKKVIHMLLEYCQNDPKDAKESLLRKKALAKAFEEGIYRSVNLMEKVVSLGFAIEEFAEFSGFSALQFALNYGKFDAVKFILEHDTNVNQYSVRGKDGGWYSTPLQYASEWNEAALVREFIRKGADVNAEPAEQKATALQFAAINGNFEIANELIKAGAYINASPAKYCGRSALEGAAEHGRLDMVRYLLEAGADVKGKSNQNYKRAVFRAWYQGHCTVAKVIQDFKIERYGVDDVEDIRVIMKIPQGHEYSGSLYWL
ncbi:ankyrin [Corynespora cassiicola Philippines]|uniref:Ankyrin n=1 Tax=Corynespora cassiicola Philippines TaxID=1448308 RepID=A0A2T2NJX5_CORCC|nr:ankyrin [Corynespora cassiicola Philippines]